MLIVTYYCSLRLILPFLNFQILACQSFEKSKTLLQGIANTFINQGLWISAMTYNIFQDIRKYSCNKGRNDITLCNDAQDNNYYQS